MTEWLYQQADAITQFLLGAFGAGVRVAIGSDKAERQSSAKIAATFVTGTILAGTASHAITEHLGLPPGFAGSISFMVGLLGIGFVYQVLDGKVYLPIISKLTGGGDQCKR